jgi:DNA replication protein DnaC
MLNCGVHICPSKCHQLYDHSKMPCEHILDRKCPQGHLQTWKCHESPPSICFKCERATKLAEQKKAKAAALQQKREAEDLAHAKKLADINEKIAVEEQAHRDHQLAEDRTRAIQQKEKDLEIAKSRTSQAVTTPPIIAGVSDENSLPSPPAASESSSGNSQPVLKSRQTTVKTRKALSSESVPTRQEAVSPSNNDWQRRKDVDGASNDAIDSIMEMIGLEEVKEQVLRIYEKIEVTRRQGTSLKDERFNIVLLGNPGTGKSLLSSAQGFIRVLITSHVGKTTVARHYAKFLSSVDVLPGSEFIETTGSRLANDGVAGIKKHLETLTNAGGGAMFVDETYQLTGEHNFQGSQVLDFMLAEMEDHIGTIVFIFAGYDKEMEKFFEHNPGLTSRVPYKLHFADYSDGELLSMMDQLIRKKYGGQMRVEDGVRGLYARIAIRRLGRGRGRAGFGNARALRNLFAKVSERQAARLQQERKKGLTPDDFMLLRQDLIGPDPSEAIVESTAWKKLQSLIGLAAVKQSIRNFFDLINTNYERELVEKEPIQVSLNRVFLGSPGTGKTTVAKLYGQILSDLGLLSGSEGEINSSQTSPFADVVVVVVMKNPADFIGSVMGASEKNTKDILANTVGKVLIIDEVSGDEELTINPSLIGSRPICYMVEVAQATTMILTRQRSSIQLLLKCKASPVKTDVCCS